MTAGMTRAPLLPRPTPTPVDLADIASLAQIESVSGSVVVAGVELDSRCVQPGDLFAALPGYREHGARHIDEAIARGAVAILTDADGRSAVPEGVPIRVTADPRSIVGAVAAEVYRFRPGDPRRERLRILGVTGTNGKTTVSYLVAAGFTAAGVPTGIVGTVGIRMGERTLPATRTTPESVHLVALLAAMAEQDIEVVAMEVSSHALSERRMDGLCVDLAGFTNLSQDHLDYHGTMEAYFQAKARLFTPAHARVGLVSVDDDWGRRLVHEAGIPVQSVSMRDPAADWFGHRRNRALDVSQRGQPAVLLDVPLPGAFNAANALLAWAMLRSSGVPPAVAARGIERARVPGRMEEVAVSGGVRGIVDYAHTPEAIERALAAVRESMSDRAQLIAVLGAGGDRDPSKRTVMGAAAASLADRVIVTDDNPRSERPADIRAALMEGARSVPSVTVEEVPGRRNAIHRAAEVARHDDVIVLLGKGHETGIESDGHVEPFDDREELSAALREVRA